MTSLGVSKRKACHFVGITRRGLNLPLKDKGAERMQETTLSFWCHNMGYGKVHALIISVFLGINIKRRYRL